MFGGRVGMPELLLILFVLLLFFGSSKLPELARSLGRSAREFKKGMSEDPEVQKKEEKG
jgi:sec-independent protein translocase protein TatA